jgi:hypothetical protein
MEFIQQLFIREMEIIRAEGTITPLTEEEILKVVIARVKNQLRAYSGLVNWASKQNI